MPDKKATTTKPSKPVSSKELLTPRNMLIAGGAIIVIVLLVVFGSGAGDPIAAHMPADALFYVNINIDELSSAEMQEIVTAFQTASGAPASEEGLDIIQQAFGGDTDWDYDIDIKPWLGNQVGISMQTFSLGPILGGGGVQPQSIAGIQSKNAGAADAFIAKVVQDAEADGDTVTTSSVSGTTIYSIDRAFTDDQAIARSGNIVYIANEAAAIEASINLKPADSIASSEGYGKAIRALPGGRLLTVYVDMNAISDMSMTAGVEASPAYSMLENSALALGVAVVPEGLQMDAAFVMDESKMSPAMLEASRAAAHPAETVDRYPQDTFLFMGSSGTANNDPEAMREMMGEETFQDYRDSLQSLQALFGIDIENLIAAIDKEFSFGLFPQSTGVGAFTGGIGIQAVILTTKDAELATFMADLNGLIVEQGGMATQARSIAGMDSYVVSDPFLGADLLALGSGNGMGFLTTNTALIEAGASPSLADSQQYEDTWKAFSSSAVPVFYLDMRGLLNAIAAMTGGEMDTAAVAPLTVVAAAIEPYRDGVTHVVMIAFIER